MTYTVERFKPDIIMLKQFQGCTSGRSLNVPLEFGCTGVYGLQLLPTDPIGSASLTFTVKDSTGNALTGYEYRLYVKSSTTGVIGAAEIIGAESQATNPVAITYNVYQTPTVAELQIIKPGYLESVTEYTIGSTPITQTITLQLETNI